MSEINRVDKPCVILAGAGTGKTYTIVEKLKYLVSNKIFSPSKIVCITFSNEAVDTISMRVRSALNDSEEMPIVRTFHAFSADLLRENGDKIGIDKEFKILDDDGAKIVLHSNLKVPPYYCHKYISAMSSAKDLGITIEEMEAYLKSIYSGDFTDIENKREQLQFAFQTGGERDREEKKRLTNELQKLSELIEFKKFIQVWKNYEKIKSKQNYLDYADLSHNALKLLNENKEISDKYDYIIVDEFQDTNKVQLGLVFALAKKGNVTIVGDMNQSIYRFRGAYKGNFEEFLEHYALSKKEVLTLQSSYRSTDKVLRVAHKVISHNYGDKEECFEVKSYNQREGDNIEVFELKNSREEARKVTEIIEKLVSSGLRKEDICVLTRTHQQAQLIKRALELKDLSYCSVERPSLLKQEIVKKIIDYLTIVNCFSSNGKGGEQAWWDLLYQSGFNSKDLITLSTFIKDNKQIENLCKLLVEELPKLNLSDEGKLKIKFISDKINKFALGAGKPIIEIIQEIYANIHMSNMQSADENEEIYYVDTFVDFVKEHSSFFGTSLSAFVHYLGIISALGIDTPVKKEDKEGIRLMTSHSTKGLEYKAVIVTNIAQKRFPMIRTQSSPFLPVHLHPEIKTLKDEDRQARLNEWEEFEKMHQLHEERRLFYVACTRAKEKLFLTYALDYGGKKFTPSQFLDELEFQNNKDVSFFVDQDERYPLLEAAKMNKELTSFSNTVVNGKEMKFSPSSLLLFDECQKKYEYKYIFNMPDEEIVDWTAIRLGKFVHVILEEGVRENYQTEKQFIDFARIMHEKDEWKEVDLKEAETMIRVFFARNKNKYNRNSLIEKHLFVELDGLKFHGYADRIDIDEKGVEIIDYKTSRSTVSPKHRRWQLGLYALAAQKYGSIRALTLDMLRLEKPLSFLVDENGNATPAFSERIEGFNINDVHDELILAARALLQAYKSGFKPCEADKHCEFCQEYVYKSR